MNHKEFEIARLAIKTDLFRIKNESRGAKEPPSSFSAQLDAFMGMKASTEAKKGTIEATAKDCIRRAEVGTGVALPIDMPVMPEDCKELARRHSDEARKAKECCEAHANDWHERKAGWERQWDEMFDRLMERKVSW